jgi:pyridoxamine 5'-phosphate oxidase
MSPADPFARFAEVYARARAASKSDPAAMVLATTGEGGAPSARFVLLRGFDERGFVFYTNRGSRKGRELSARPRAALAMYWPEIGEQVRVEGAVEHATDEESDAYFATRERDSQLGAWASEQSRRMATRTQGAHRLHQRVLYVLDGAAWRTELLQP